MQKFADDVSILDADNSLVPLSSASVTVYHAGTTTAASIFSDDGVTPTSNPLTTAEDGSFEFYAANGKYDILIEKSPYKPHHENGILLDDSSVVISGSVSSVISADTSLATRMSSADSVVLSNTVSADDSVVTRLFTVDSTNISTSQSSIDSVVTAESTVESFNQSAHTSLTTRDSELDSSQTSADVSVVSRLSEVDSINLSTAMSAADSASGVGGVSQSYVDSTDTSVVTVLSTVDSINLSSAISAADSAAAVGGGASTSYVDSTDVSVVTRLSTVDSTNLSAAQSAADSAASASSQIITNTNEHRLTLESGVPVSSTDQTAKTTLYFTNYNGKYITLYNGSEWEFISGSEISIPLTDTQSCTTVNGDATLTVEDTSQLIVGMEISGTGIAGGTTILSITNATILEMSSNATANGTNNITFKIPASKVIDVFIYNLSDSPKLVFGPIWTNTTTRSTSLTTKDGCNVLSGSYSISGTSYSEGKLKWIGTIGTTATAGQTEDSETGRYVWNKYNKENRELRSYNTDSGWVLNGIISTREFQNGTNQIRGKFIVGESQQFHITMNGYCSGGDNGQALGFMIACDSTSAPIDYGGNICAAFCDSDLVVPYVHLGPAHAQTTVLAGYHYFTQLEYSAYAGVSATNFPASGYYSTLHTTFWG